MSEGCPHCGNGYVVETRDGRSGEIIVPCPACGGDTPTWSSWDPGPRSKEGYGYKEEEKCGTLDA